MVQVFTSILLIKQSSLNSTFLNDQNFGIILLSYGLLILFVTAIINFINFIILGPKMYGSTSSI